MWDPLYHNIVSSLLWLVAAIHPWFWFKLINIWKYCLEDIDYDNAGINGGVRHCVSTAGFALDRDGLGCNDWYHDPYFANTCGWFDDDNFFANTMCCGCGGGHTPVYPPSGVKMIS